VGVDHRQLLTYVVRPTLTALALPGGVLAEKLVMGTAAQESRFQYLHQLGKGPALSLWQIEPVTAMDTLRRAPVGYLDRLDTLCPGALPVNNSNVIDRLVGDLFLGAAMCRLVYYMKPFTMHADAVSGREAPEWCAWIWKKYYNTMKGKGTTAEFLRWWEWFKLDDLWKGDE
jgi:hypothetical protein